MFAQVWWPAVLMFATGDSATPPRLEIDPQIAEMVRQVDAQRVKAHVRRLVDFGTRNTLSETESATRGIGAARRWLVEELTRASQSTGGRLRVETQGYPQEPDGNRITKPIDIVNVVATLPGTDSEGGGRTYVVSGHYDSMCSDPKDYECDAPGANDDASGVAAVLELAHVLSGHTFEATIVFLLTAGEEQGLLGSAYSARQAKERGVQVAGMITNDIVGSSAPADGLGEKPAVRVFSEGVPLSETEEDAARRQRIGSENDSPSRQLARYIDWAAEAYVPEFDVVLVFRTDRFLRGGDHKSYNRVGFPAVRFTEMKEDYGRQHQNVRLENGVQLGDLPEFVDPGYVAQVARVNLAAVASLARAPAAPREVRVDVSRLTNDTRLYWSANGESDLAGYEVVWRETTAPQWQRAQRVGPVTEFTSPLSKDNFIFGVCAVDQQGHRSEVVYPLPSK